MKISLLSVVIGAAAVTLGATAFIGFRIGGDSSGPA